MKPTRVISRLCGDLLHQQNKYKPLQFSLRESFQTRLKSSHLLCQNITRSFSRRPHTDILLWSVLSQTSTVQITLVPSFFMLLLLWHCKFCLKHSPAFLIQTLKAQSPPKKNMARPLTLTPKSLMTISVAVQFLFLRGDTSTMVTLVKENIYLRLAYSSEL